MFLNLQAFAHEGQDMMFSTNVLLTFISEGFSNTTGTLVDNGARSKNPRNCLLSKAYIFGL